MTIADYQSPAGCPAARPRLADMSPDTREIHEGIDAAIGRAGVPYLHPDGPTIQLDMLGSRRMAAWQEGKAAALFMGEECWSELPQVYGRYGVDAGIRLIGEVRRLENAPAAIVTDCGMQACALLADILVTAQSHVVTTRQVYNKTKKYVEWLASRVGASYTLVDDGDLDALEAAVVDRTTLVLVETFTNPLTRALDPEQLSALGSRLRKERAPRLRIAVDDTIASPWAFSRPLLDYEGIDVVVASGTKSLGGQDRDMWGYIASSRVDLLNEVMDLQATRGGALDWRRAEGILANLGAAREAHERRCQSASSVAAFLESHPGVSETFHPSLASHRDRDVIERHYRLPGALLSFRVAGATEEETRHFCDVLATCGIARYALSFDGLATKLNHHRTVSEYFTPPEELERCGFDRLVRLGVGLEASEDLVACLNWALCHWRSVPPETVLEWQKARESELGIDD